MSTSSSWPVRRTVFVPQARLLWNCPNIPPPSDNKVKKLHDTISLWAAEDAAEGSHKTTSPHARASITIAFRQQYLLELSELVARGSQELIVQEAEYHARMTKEKRERGKKQKREERDPDHISDPDEEERPKKIKKTHVLSRPTTGGKSPKFLAPPPPPKPEKEWVFYEHPDDVNLPDCTRCQGDIKRSAVPRGNFCAECRADPQVQILRREKPNNNDESEESCSSEEEEMI